MEIRRTGRRNSGEKVERMPKNAYTNQTWRIVYYRYCNIPVRVIYIIRAYYYLRHTRGLICARIISVNINFEYISVKLSSGRTSESITERRILSYARALYVILNRSHFSAHSTAYRIVFKWKIPSEFV